MNMGRRFSWQAVQQLTLVGLLAVVAVVFTVMTAGFAQVDNLRNILLDASPTIIGAVAMTFVIVTRGIDLSVGSVANFALAAAVMLAGTKSAVSITTDTSWLVYPVALICGLGLGLLNGLIITRLQVNPLITTLGTLTLYRGLGLHLTSASLYSVEGPIQILGRGQFLGLGLPVYLALGAAGLGAFVLARTVSGRQLLALGGSPRSADETGIRTARLLRVVYALAGLSGALAGLIIVGRVGVLTSELGYGFEFTVITAVVLGGTSLFGGRGSIIGSVIGALLLTTIQNGLNLIGADPYIYDVVRGLILMLAVTMDTVTSRLSERRLYRGV